MWINDKVNFVHYDIKSKDVLQNGLYDSSALNEEDKHGSHEEVTVQHINMRYRKHKIFAKYCVNVKKKINEFTIIITHTHSYPSTSEIVRE